MLPPSTVSTGINARMKFESSWGYWMLMGRFVVVIRYIEQHASNSIENRSVFMNEYAGMIYLSDGLLSFESF